MIKQEIRVIGIDDSPFNKFKEKEVLATGVVLGGGKGIDGILSTKVLVDGDDATTKLAEMINKSKFRLQLRCIFLDGIALAGFNVVDIRELSKKTGIPAVTIIRRKPDVARIKEVLNKLNQKGKIVLLDKAGSVVNVGKT